MSAPTEEEITAAAEQLRQWFEEPDERPASEKSVLKYREPARRALEAAYRLRG